jgi:AcrR family transcriptional regulator
MTLTLEADRTGPQAGAADPGAAWATGALGRQQGRPAAVVLLSEARTGRRIVRAARELLAVADYAAVDFGAVAQVAGVRPEDVSRRFASRRELTLAALELPPSIPAARRGRLGGVQTVLRFLSFWEMGDNTAILANALRAAMRDCRCRREVEEVLGGVLFVPLATGLGTTDAGPRARLVTSALVGLAVTRYILREEPIASADHGTLAAWMGPSIDCYLQGALGA